MGSGSKGMLARTLSDVFPLRKPMVPEELWGPWNAFSAILTPRGRLKRSGKVRPFGDLNSGLLDMHVVIYVIGGCDFD